MIKKLIAGAGVALAGLVVRLFMKYGIPAFVEKIATNPRLPLAVKLEIRDMAPVVVQLVEVLGKHHNWRGELKTIEALKRIEEEIGRQLSPEELSAALSEIKRAVRILNKKAGTEVGGLSFAEFVMKERNNKTEGGGTP